MSPITRPVFEPQTTAATGTIEPDHIADIMGTTIDTEEFTGAPTDVTGTVPGITTAPTDATGAGLDTTTALIDVTGVLITVHPIITGDGTHIIIILPIPSDSISAFRALASILECETG